MTEAFAHVGRSFSLVFHRRDAGSPEPHTLFTGSEYLVAEQRVLRIWVLFLPKSLLGKQSCLILSRGEVSTLISAGSHQP